MPQKTIRVPLATEFLNRDATLTKDSRLINCYVEKYYDGRTAVVKRPGLSSFQELGNGMGQGIVTHNGKLVSVVANKVYASGLTGGSRTIATNNEVVYFEVLSLPLAEFPNRGPNTPVVTAPTSAPLNSVTNAGNTSVMASLDGLPYNARSKDFLFIKGNSCAYSWNGYDNELTQVVDTNYPLTTVAGVVHLDGYIFVMDNNGVIYNSNLQNQLTWNPLNFIQAEVEPDGGVAIVKHLNYIIAFGRYSTEFFYDAANPLGSPLSRIDNAFSPIGCANGNSVVGMDTSVIFISQTKEDNAKTGRGREVTMISGMTPKKISTPFIDRILSNDALVNVRAMTFKSQGHDFYILNLIDSSITLVFDVTMGIWVQWTGQATLPYYLAESCSIGRTTPDGTKADKITIIGGLDGGDYYQMQLIDNTYLVTWQPNQSFQAVVLDDGNTTVYIYDFLLRQVNTVTISGRFFNTASWNVNPPYTHGKTYLTAMTRKFDNNFSLFIVDIYARTYTQITPTVTGFIINALSNVDTSTENYILVEALKNDDPGFWDMSVYSLNLTTKVYTLLTTISAENNIITSMDYYVEGSIGTFIYNGMAHIPAISGTTTVLLRYSLTGVFIDSHTISTGIISKFINVDMSHAIAYYSFVEANYTTITMLNLYTFTTVITGLPKGQISFLLNDTVHSHLVAYDFDAVNTYNYSGTLLATTGSYISDPSVMTAFFSSAETFYSPSFHTNVSGTDYLLDYGSGTVWKTSEIYGNDAFIDIGTSAAPFSFNNKPIPVHIITPNIDLGNNHSKFVSELEFIGDKVNGTMQVSYTSNDYQSWLIPYRQTSLSKQRARLHRLGKARRRAYEFYYTDNTPLRLEAVDLTIDGGEE